MSDYAGDKSLEPTPHRRQQARQEGHVAKSQDLGSAAMLLLGVGVVMMLGGGLVGFLVNYCRSQLGGQPVLTIDAESVASQWNATLWALGRYLLPILGLLCLAGVAVNVLQTGLLFLPQKLSFDFSRISPIRGWQRIFSVERRGPSRFRHVQADRRFHRGRRGVVQPARGAARTGRPGAAGSSPCK